MKPTILVALLAGMSLLATSSFLVSQQGDSQGGNTGDHGDNPVVGSLPCAVDPNLDAIFGARTYPSTFTTPVLGMVGGQDLSFQILDADGTPYGLINRGADYFSTMGLVHDGYITVKRNDAAKAYMLLQQWLPDAYLGGTVSMSSSLGNPSRTINSNLIDLPLLMIAAMPGPVAEARITIESPNSTVPTIVVYISAVGSLLTVSYTP